MSPNGEFDRNLESWLTAEAPRTAPPGLHDGVMERARGSNQRPAWLVAVRGGTIGGPAVVAGRLGIGGAWLLVALALLLAAFMVAIAGGAFRPPADLPSGRNGAIVYAVGDISGPPYNHVHLVNADGRGDREIAQGSCPVFSRDGRVLAYMSGSWRDKTALLQVAAADGSSPHVVPDVGDSGYALSPDGTQVAWLGSGVPAGDEIWLTEVAGGAATRLVAPTGNPDETYSFPVWSPDGRQIAFATNLTVTGAGNSGSYRTAISVVNADGSGLRRLTARPGTDFVGISWSPDSRLIAYTGLPDGSPLPSFVPTLGPPDSFYPDLDIFVIRADGTDDRNLTNSATNEIDPAWSPDGSQLAYLAFEDGSGYRLSSVRMDGPRALGAPIRGPAVDMFTWSPDGATFLTWHHLASTSEGSSQTMVELVDAAFRSPSVVLLDTNTEVSCAPSWQRLEPTSPGPVASAPTTTATATASPTGTAAAPTTPPTLPGSAVTALEDLGSSGVLDTGVTYTSNLFEPRVTFKLATRDGLLDTSGQVPDWCSPVNMEAPLQTGPRTIVLSHPKSCRDELRLIRPYAVDCGTPDAHPDAATLAAALLGDPGATTARDLGSLQTPGSRLFLHAYNARGIGIGLGAQPDGTGPGDGPCRLLPEPGSSDPPIDLRQGAPSNLVLIDVRGELVILRAAWSGGLEGHLLSRIYDIAFP